MVVPCLVGNYTSEMLLALSLGESLLLMYLMILGENIQ